MAYIPNKWVDREGTTRYFESVEKDGAKIFTPDYTQLTEIGTPVNADNMNHIEEGIAAGSFTKYNSDEIYQLNDLVTCFVDDELKVFKSLQNENHNNPVTNTSFWEEVALGGGSGLEVCDIGMSLYVDETKGLRRYLNGQIVDINTNTQAFLNRLKDITTLHPSLLCTEDEWQTAKTMSAFGQVGKFVFNYSGDEVVSVRIPRVVNVQGLFDLQNLGLTVGAGLPNITGSVEITKADSSGTGAFLSSTNGTGGAGTNSSGKVRFYAQANFDASNSNSIYGNSDTVQQESIQYPYFIQIATGSETENNIINEIELNNPYSLFDSKYSDHELNNLSWLKSEGQWNAKAVYPTAYDKLLKVYNGTETVEGLSVKLSTEEYTDYDFVLNTSDETFRLPLLDGDRVLVAKKVPTSDDLTWFNWYSDGWLEQGGSVEGTTSITVQLVKHFASINYSAFATVEGATQSYTCSVVINSNSQITIQSGASSTCTKLWQTSGYGAIPQPSDYTDGINLYYYVGETVQNANLIDAGRIGEVLPTKTDKVQAAQSGMPSGRYIDLTLGASGTTYTAPANGYFSWSGLLKGTVASFSLYNKTTSLGTQSYSNYNADTGINGFCFVPVSKGDVVVNENYASTSLTTNYFRFIYAEGEV